MAAKATGDRPRAEVQTESIVNRWIVDYYVSLALRAFQGGQYADFCSVKNVVDGVSARPLDCIDEIHLKIQVLQFLTWINEGEELDMSSASDQSITPLELALDLLQPMSQNSSIPHQEFENVCTSVKEMIMVIFIKNNRFDKAKEMLTKHFSRPMVGKRVIFMGLINKRSKRHDVIEQMDFGQFKTEMLAFCQRLCPFPVPFLHKQAAKLLIDERLTQRDDNAAGPDEQDEPGPSCSEHINTVLPVSCKHKIIQRTRLEAAYKTLAAKSDMRTFSQLEEELEREEEARQDDLTLRLSPTPNEGTNQGSEEDGLFQRGSCSPMEASPADLPPQTDAAPQTPAGSLSKSSSVLGNRRAYTVAQLVLEPDSQVSSQCTAASPELETEVITEESSQSPVTVSERKASQSPITDYEIIKPSRKHRRRTNHCCSRASTSSAVLTESEDEPPASEANEEVCVEKTHNQSNRSLRSNSSKSHGGDTLSEGEEDPQESSASFRTPVQKTPQQARVSLINDPDNADDFNIDDSSLDDSPSVSFRPVPQTSSTPDKDSAHNKDSLHSKWKQLYKSAKESKERWSDEESDCLSRKNNGSNESTTSNSTNRKRKWTERETQMLKEGVRKFGEGNWSKIKAYYTFNGRTNVNLKDRWRTLKKLKQD